MRKYTDYDRQKSAQVRLANALAYPPPYYSAARTDGELYLRLNGIETYVYLEPAGNITQWKSTINGVLFRECAGMSQVYSEVAKLNPPARSDWD